MPVKTGIQWFLLLSTNLDFRLRGNDDYTAATNDVGIVTLPNGQHFIIVVFVSNSNAESKDRDEIIANIAKIVWDAYLTG